MYEMKLSATARAFGVYRVPTGLSIDANICDENKKNFMGIILDFIGIRECPPKKGVYSNEDFMPEVPSFAVYALHNVHLCVDAVLYGKPDIMLMKLKIFLKIN
ncbi:uncharacterized protein LOC103316506 [Nasonia vitripennis]|uniref:Uncharacterized protein n=1 Tax=Nasonia vitripennis TaxID=7425 RepID=A0A7M7LUI7_NASVI|nr:uncharacterized protein LOC103316506 [Nasonia vitripennis]